MDAKTTTGNRLHPIFQQALAPFAPAPQFTEAELIEADLRYLASQRERDARRQAETANLERAYMARRGWGL